MSKGKDIMGFLNEIGGKYPKAISLASGRPNAALFQIEKALLALVAKFQNCTADEKEEVATLLGQYNKAKGIIQADLKAYYQKDFDWKVDQKDLLITVGAQEAMSLAISVFCENGRYGVAYGDPSYIGFSKYADLSGVIGHSIPVDASATMDLDKLELVLKEQVEGKTPVKLIYVMPDFQNPTGAVMSLKKRMDLLELAEKYNAYLFEDNAYGLFRYEGKRIPFLRELDKTGRVIYVESFSKSIFPSIRIAAVNFSAEKLNKENASYLAEMVALKGYITVNTSTLNQGILSEILKQNDYSLRKYNYEKIADLKKKKEAICQAIIREQVKHGIKLEWSVPEGGFFLVLKTPFTFINEDVEVAAKDFGVIFSLYNFFSAQEIDATAIRLAFSEHPPEKLDEAVTRLFNFFKHKTYEINKTEL